ncbi:g8496 [Coccomyxa elongata]
MTQAGDEAYVLIDYEHAGEANRAARFSPLDHWPDECKAPGAVYTPAADVYSVGRVMRRSGLALDAEALAFCAQLMGPAIARPSAADALLLPWLAGL